MLSSISSSAGVRLRGLAGLLFVVMVGAVTLMAQAAQAPAPPKPATPKPATPKTAPATRDVSAALPSARSIIDRHIKEIGGRAAILAHTSQHASGTISMPANGISGALDVYGAKPDKSLVKINLGGIGDIVEGFDGTNGWSLQPMTGPMLKEGKELAEKKFDADFYGDLHEPGRYASMKTVEKTTFDGRPCYKISLARKDGGEDIEFYDVETGLKAGAIGTRQTPMGPITATLTLSEYKKFEGLLVAMTMKQSQMGIEQVLKLTTLEWDNVPPSTFDPPAQIKALIK
jgi:hypothetical protein